MKIIRPITPNDTEALTSLAFRSSLGITSLPKDPDLLYKKILDSGEAFQEKYRDPHLMLYLFVLEDLEHRQILGTCAIQAKTGGTDPLFFYRIEKQTLATEFPSPPLSLLRPISYTEGPTELCGIYLMPEARLGGIGRLLSLSRLLFIASHRNRFEQKVFADMRGVFDEQNQNIFWNYVGRRFCNLPIEEALDIVSHSKNFYSKIVPPYPIYIDLLPPDIQAVIGQVHPHTHPALRLLQEEGFQFMQEINMIDGGPRIEAPTNQISTIQFSQKAVVKKLASSIENSPSFLVSNLSLQFRACISPLSILDASTVTLPAAVADALQVGEGDEVRYIPKEPQKLDFRLRQSPGLQRS